MALGSKFSTFGHRMHNLFQSSRKFCSIAGPVISVHETFPSFSVEDWRHGISNTVKRNWQCSERVTQFGCKSQTTLQSLSSSVALPRRVPLKNRVNTVVGGRCHRRAGNSSGSILVIGLLSAATFFINGASALDFAGTYANSQARFENSFLSDVFSVTDSADAESPPSISKRPTPPIEFAHGTTTLSFSFQGGIVAAVDSRATLGSFVGSKTTQKVLPINSHIIGTMAGGAADCMHWIRKIRCEAALYELTEGHRMPVAQCSRILSNCLYTNRGLGLSMGTMIMGFDDTGLSVPKIFYVDDTGMRIEGDMFAVGSGSTLALGILDSERRYEMTEEEALALGIKAIRHATFRDAYSGGFINVYLITRDGWKRVYTEDLDRLAVVQASNEL